MVGFNYTWCRSLGRDELLAAVDGVGGSGQGGVGHDVDGERSDVSGFDDTSDWERRAQLVTPLFEIDCRAAMPTAAYRRSRRRSG